LEPLKNALRDHRRDKRDLARAALGDRPWSALQLSLALGPRAMAESDKLKQPLAHYARKAVAKAWKPVAKRGQRLDRLDRDERHELRKALKRLRYTIEFFGPLYRARAVRPFVKQLKQLQDVFGYVNDVEAARRIEGIVEERCRTNSDAQRVAGYLIGWHTAQADACWAGVAGKWRDLERSACFWG
jgi:CHAD domain-containing protein